MTCLIHRKLKTKKYIYLDKKTRLEITYSWCYMCDYERILNIKQEVYTNINKWY